MTFNSTAFLFLFLPLAVALSAFGERCGRSHLRWLIFLAVSFGFYVFSGLRNVGVFLLSVVVGYLLVTIMAKVTGAGRRWWLWLVIGFQLALLGFFKYANFFLANWAMVVGADVTPLALAALPLGISFYVFNQIGHAVAVYRGEAVGLSLLEYATTVSFFPYLTSGPLVSLGNVAEQMQGKGRRWTEDVAVGLSLMVVGLFKKVVLGDTMAGYADHIFALAATPASVDFVHSWLGALSYTFQIYFDFSGYTDMAIGVARMFGIVLPQNFNSPYKSASVAEFWRRWHITLSRFFRDHLYIPLGGNRKGPWRQSVNLMITMVLCGLWHGAGWPFVLWGALHGLYLSGQRRLGELLPPLGRPAKVVITFLLLVVSWVVFRAGSLAVIGKMLVGMAGAAGFWTISGGIKVAHCVEWLAGCALICFVMPNSQQLFGAYHPCLIYRGYNDNLARPRFAWSPGWVSFGVIFGLWLIALYHLDRGGSFIYAQF